MLKKPGKIYLPLDVFRCIVDNAPLVSVDLLLFHEGKVLLGKRKNPPAWGCWFTLGGRVIKNERISDAIHRIAKEEAGWTPKSAPEFVGVFEHLYEDGVFYDVSTHYINLAYRFEVEELKELPTDQHYGYRWFDVEELLESDEVHHYVKDYFTKEKGTIPQ